MASSVKTFPSVPAETEQRTTVPATHPSKPKSLAAKLAEIILTVSHVAKRGTNDFHKYDYATESDVLEAVRRGLAERSVVIVPRCVGVSVLERERDGKASMFVTTADMILTLVDGESGEVMECPWKGSGEDSGDKGLYKALTGGNKYFLLKLFMIPTGDDPEKDKRKPKGGQSEAPTPIDPGSDAAVILALADAIGKATGQKPADVIKAFSSFKGKDKNDPTKEREVFFTDPRKATSLKWLATTRQKLEIENRKLSGSEPGAAEGAALFGGDDPFAAPCCGGMHAPGEPCPIKK